MIDKKALRTALGYPFTSKQKAMQVLGVKVYSSVNPYFYGLACIGQRYWTDDVIERMLSAVKYNDEESVNNYWNY